MDRKEKCIRIIDYYGDHREDRQFRRLVNKYGWENLFTDEAIELYATEVMRDHRSSEKLRRENFKRMEQQRKANG